MEEQNINLSEILNIFVKRWWIILISGLVTGLLTFAYSAYLIDPTYTSSGTLYVVNNPESQVHTYTASEYTLSVQLVNTYSEILKSSTFCQTISKRLNSRISASQVKSMLTMSGVGETEILRVNAVSKNPELAREVVQEVLNNAPEEIMRVVKAGSVEIIDNASMPTSPTAPNVRRNTVIGCLVGLILAALAIYILEMFDTTVKDEDELSEKYEVPVLGIIPDLTK